jgi:hypothetical protein
MVKRSFAAANAIRAGNARSRARSSIMAIHGNAAAGTKAARRKLRPATDRWAKPLARISRAAGRTAEEGEECEHESEANEP